MKFIAAAILASLAATPVFAQVAPSSTYAPITMDQADYTALMQFLQTVPYGYAAPIIQDINNMETQATEVAHRTAAPVMPSSVMPTPTVPVQK